jgi:hypothetical protein
MQEKIIIWESAGILFIIVAGTLFHFVYPWTKTVAAGVFFPVNESVWEHLKLGFWSVLLFAAIEYPFIGRGRASFLVAKAAGIFSLQAFILLLFYGYHLFSGRNLLFIDIASYVMGAVLCQFIGILVMRRVNPGPGATAAALCFLLLHAAALFVFTFTPPRLPLFMDSRTKTYGIQSFR